jgi:hypothetical protein
VLHAIPPGATLDVSFVKRDSLMSKETSLMSKETYHMSNEAYERGLVYCIYAIPQDESWAGASSLRSLPLCVH